MVCSQCSKELFACTCEDIDQRLRDLENHPATALVGRMARRERQVYQLGYKQGRDDGRKCNSV